MSVVPAIMARTGWKIPQIIAASVYLGKLLLIDDLDTPALMSLPLGKLLSWQYEIELTGPMKWRIDGKTMRVLLSLLGGSSRQGEIDDTVSDLITRLYLFLQLRGPRGDGGQPMPVIRSEKEAEDMPLQLAA